jgi:hypothetical protein
MVSSFGLRGLPFTGKISHFVLARNMSKKSRRLLRAHFEPCNGEQANEEQGETEEHAAVGISLHLGRDT